MQRKPPKTQSPAAPEMLGSKGANGAISDYTTDDIQEDTSFVVLPQSFPVLVLIRKFGLTPRRAGLVAGLANLGGAA
jgi:hypothetical protein